MTSRALMFGVPLDSSVADPGASIDVTGSLETQQTI
jgi:hypothetical protein